MNTSSKPVAAVELPSGAAPPAGAAAAPVEEGTSTASAASGETEAAAKARAKATGWTGGRPRGWKQDSGLSYMDFWNLQSSLHHPAGAAGEPNGSGAPCDDDGASSDGDDGDNGGADDGGGATRKRRREAAAGGGHGGASEDGDGRPPRAALRHAAAPRLSAVNPAAPTPVPATAAPTSQCRLIGKRVRDAASGATDVYGVVVKVRKNGWVSVRTADGAVAKLRRSSLVRFGDDDDDEDDDDDGDDNDNDDDGEDDDDDDDDDDDASDNDNESHGDVHAFSRQQPRCGQWRGANDETRSESEQRRGRSAQTLKDLDASEEDDDDGDDDDEDEDEDEDEEVEEEEEEEEDDDDDTNDGDDDEEVDALVGRRMRDVAGDGTTVQGVIVSVKQNGWVCVRTDDGDFKHMRRRGDFNLMSDNDDGAEDDDDVDDGNEEVDEDEDEDEEDQEEGDDNADDVAKRATKARALVIKYHGAAEATAAAKAAFARHGAPPPKGAIAPGMVLRCARGRGVVLRQQSGFILLRLAESGQELFKRRKDVRLFAEDNPDDSGVARRGAGHGDQTGRATIARVPPAVESDSGGVDARDSGHAAAWAGDYLLKSTGDVVPGGVTAADEVAAIFDEVRCSDCVGCSLSMMFCCRCGIRMSTRVCDYACVCVSLTIPHAARSLTHSHRRDSEPPRSPRARSTRWRRTSPRWSRRACRRAALSAPSRRERWRSPRATCSLTLRARTASERSSTKAAQPPPPLPLRRCAAAGGAAAASAAGLAAEAAAAVRRPARADLAATAGSPRAAIRRWRTRRVQTKPLRRPLCAAASPSLWRTSFSSRSCRFRMNQRSAILRAFSLALSRSPARSRARDCLKASRATPKRSRDVIDLCGRPD